VVKHAKKNHPALNFGAGGEDLPEIRADVSKLSGPGLVGEYLRLY